MKTLENMTKGNALVAVKNLGEKLHIVVTDSKNIGKVVAQWAFPVGNFNENTPVLEPIKVVDVKASIYRKISKIVKSVEEAVEFDANDEKLKKLSEVLANEEENYDLNSILAAAELGKRTIIVVSKDGGFGLAKTTTGRKSATIDKLKEAGYNVEGRFDVDNQKSFINVAITTDELKVTGIDEATKDYVLSLVPAKEEEATEQVEAQTAGE